MNLTLWSMINQTDFVSKAILLALLVMSIICWAFAIYKHIIIRTKLKQINQAKKLLNNITSLEDFLARASSIQETFAGLVISNYLSEFKTFLKLNDDKKNSLSDTDWQLLQANIYQTLDSYLHKEESLVPFLSTCAQAAPLMGLFGTVWGLIHSFMGIAQQKSADIAAVAPGIAEALITTLGGLIVAIPALVMFNYVMGQIRVLEQKLVALADRCLWIMRSIGYQQMNLPHRNTPYISPEMVTNRESI